MELTWTSRKRASRYELGTVLRPWHQPAMSAYHDDLQLFNTGVGVGLDSFALRIADFVVYFPFAGIRCRCLYPEKLWLYLQAEERLTNIG